MGLAVGTRLGVYEVLGSLGAGGMGEVYRAHDPRLGRDVALKILPQDMVSDVVRLERFAREARALAALNHPHIVTLYSTEEAEGLRFLTMELVEGQPLDRVIANDGLPLRQFLEIAVPLADAVSAAHEKHLTHRDLKPANVMVSGDGRVKVLDFGLATFTQPARIKDDMTRVELTHQGTVLGTVPYMSPEQIEGKALDYRTDIFSLGIVLYEMATGVRPFQGDSSPALMSSILKDHPPPIRDVRPDLPGVLGRLIGRCLEKRPEERMQTARDVLNELKALGRELESGSSAVRRSTGSARGTVGSIAVSPFDHRAGDDDSKALADGLGEEITGGLARFSYLSVVTDASAARYRVSGSVRRAGVAVRIRAQLVDAEHSTHLWAETYTRDVSITDIFSIQDDITARVVATVADAHGVLMRTMAQSVRDRSPGDLSARELMLRYWGYDQQHTPDEHARLRDAFEAITARSSNDAEIWAALAHLYCHEVAFGFNPQPHALARAFNAARRAVDLDATSQHGWNALALGYFFEHDRDAFLGAAERAMSLNPHNASALAWMATLIGHMGDDERASEIAARAMALNPHHPGWYYFPSFERHYFKGEFVQALQIAKKVNMPDHLWSAFVIATVCGQLGRLEEGRAAVLTFRAIAPALADINAVRALVARWQWEESRLDLLLDGFQKAAAAVDGD